MFSLQIIQKDFVVWVVFFTKRGPYQKDEYQQASLFSGLK